MLLSLCPTPTPISKTKILKFHNMCLFSPIMLATWWDLSFKIFLNLSLMTSFPLFSLSRVSIILKLNIIFFSCHTPPHTHFFALLLYFLGEFLNFIDKAFYLIGLFACLLSKSCCYCSCSLNFFLNILFFLGGCNIFSYLSEYTSNLGKFTSPCKSSPCLFSLFKNVSVFYIKCFPQMYVILCCQLIFQSSH